MTLTRERPARSGVRAAVGWVVAVVVALAAVVLLAPGDRGHHATLLDGPRVWWALVVVAVAALTLWPRAWPGTVRWVATAVLCLPVVWLVVSGRLADDALVRSASPDGDLRVAVHEHDPFLEDGVRLVVDRPGPLLTYRYPARCTTVTAGAYDVRWTSPTSFDLVPRGDDEVPTVGFTVEGRAVTADAPGLWGPCRD
ncbi:hypothetical protein GCM10023340_31450 [Nocardioides marinquilinus]|uniref:DUF1109 domain-containing protein n=1 Tax=Nocardioides marinquilinus TaxID=1210400 RepID=A0ABP9PW11_9ACTN